ncbi:unnamed protein product [Bursaphelenchus xylophilus]|uniref:(pine wood nematode) hypothetical protein n=1 Tax=Bursaphelenchus xylophilus TaxID=6326 RepID=A0A1I7RMW4_BURXY|nr:unnamed protein product [Bursaphelenchus xylophilus]CAG9125400.1 unnamed protein product [Bursaphelenchus xylophilus]
MRYSSSYSLDKACISMKSNKVITVYYPKTFPAVNEHCPEHQVLRKCPWPGLFVEYIQMFASYSHYQIRPYVNAELDVLVNENGDWRMAFELLRNGTIDTIAYGFMKTAIRLKQYDFSDVLYNSPIYPIHRKSFGDTESTFSFFTIYGRDVVLALGSIIFLQVAFYFTHSMLFDVQRRSPYNAAVDSVWSALALQLGQSTKGNKRSRAVNFNRLMFSFINTPILLGLYSTWIVSNRLSADTDGTITSYQDLINKLSSGQKYLIEYTGTVDWFFEEIESSNVFPFKDIRNTLQRNPTRRVTINQSYQHLNDGDGVALLPDDTQSFQKVLELCNLEKINTAIESIDRRFLLRQNRPDRLVQDLNAFIRKKVPAIALVYNKYRGQLTKGRAQCGRRRPDTQRPYRGLMYVWLGLCAASTLVFCFEVLLSLRGKRLKLTKKTASIERDSRLVFGPLGRVGGK